MRLGAPIPPRAIALGNRRIPRLRNERNVGGHSSTIEQEPPVVASDTDVFMTAKDYDNKTILRGVIGPLHLYHSLDRECEMISLGKQRPARARRRKSTPREWALQNGIPCFSSFFAAQEQP